ncbi:MAG TPA: hypothetical protein VEU11_12335 [Terriglobales bacterium]|nr:hypothetical protein [Terriglobales bacterium]
MAKARGVFAFLAFSVGVAASAGGGPASDSAEWPNYGNDPGGTRYSPLAEINRQNTLP